MPVGIGERVSVVFGEFCVVTKTRAGRVLMPVPRSAVEIEALRIWRERELGFPAWVRRMRPDDLDRASGAWDAVCGEAHARIVGEKKHG